MATQESVSKSSPWVAPAVVLTVADMLFTLIWLSEGIAVEANPLVNAAIEAVGAPLALGIRGLVGVLLVMLLGLLTRRSRLAPIALPLVTAVLGGVVVWHIAGGLAATLV